MANPPIQIGELTDVPAIGSPISANWAQEATQRIVHHFATVAERAAKYPAPLAGSLSTTLDRNVLDYWNGTAWSAVAPSRIEPAYYGPTGGGSGGALLAGQTARAARFTLPVSGVYRFSYGIAVTATSPLTGKVALVAVTNSATVWTTFFQLVAGIATVSIPGIPINGLGAGQFVDVMVTNDATSSSQLNWFADNSNHKGSAEYPVRLS